MKLHPTQKSYVPSEKDLAKKWFLVDAKGKTLGQLATKIANIIRGKLKTHFTPKADCGDHVVVINAKEVRLSRNKMDSKMYYWHTQYPGGIRSRSARQMLDQKPESVLYDAVWGMLPRNKLRHTMMKKLRVFAGPEHKNISQSPQPIEL
jgi:large subunit ribosomal protein L13